MIDAISDGWWPLQSFRVGAGCLRNQPCEKEVRTVSLRYLASREGTEAEDELASNGHTYVMEPPQRTNMTGFGDILG